MPCDLPREDLSAYIDDELAEERKSFVEAHLVQCSECTEELAFLRTANATVGSLVEYSTPRSFETDLRHDVLTYRTKRSRWWSLGGRLQRRHVIAILCALCGAAMLVTAVRLRVFSPRAVPEPAVRVTVQKEAAESATVAPSAEPRSVKAAEPRVKPAVREPSVRPVPPAHPSPYEGWWMLSVGTPVEFRYPVRIRQQDGELAIYGWGSGSALGSGVEVDGRLTATGAPAMTLEIEFSPSRPEFTGLLDLDGEPPRRVFADRIGPPLDGLLVEYRDLPSFIDSRLAHARKLSAALYSYNRANGDRFPTTLADLIPRYLPEDSMLADGTDLETVYNRPASAPADNVVDWQSYDGEELTAEDRLMLLDQQEVARFHAFFEQMVIQQRDEFPEGRTIVYVDGSVAWDGISNVPALLMPEMHARIENEHERTCKSRLGNLGRALTSFAGDHDGFLPLHTEMLWPTYLQDAENLCCPSYGAHEVAYEIVCLGERLPSDDELELEPDLLSTITLAVEIDDLHRDGFHVLTADGEVKWHAAYDR